MQYNNSTYKNPITYKLLGWKMPFDNQHGLVIEFPIVVPITIEPMDETAENFKVVAIITNPYDYQKTFIDLESFIYEAI